MKTINAKYIRSLRPCQEGIENFEQMYPNFSGTIVDILKLENVPYNDKIWLAEKEVELLTLQQWSVECAESVLPNYEKAFPNDTRIRDCIETIKKVLNGKLAESAAVSAARSAWSAARAAAESAAWSAAYAARAAAESAARSAAESAAEKEQEDLNLSLLIALIENEEV